MADVAGDLVIRVTADTGQADAAFNKFARTADAIDRPLGKAARALDLVGTASAGMGANIADAGGKIASVAGLMAGGGALGIGLAAATAGVALITKGWDLLNRTLAENEAATKKAADAMLGIAARAHKKTMEMQAELADLEAKASGKDLAGVYLDRWQNIKQQADRTAIALEDANAELAKLEATPTGAGKGAIPFFMRRDMISDAQARVDVLRTNLQVEDDLTLEYEAQLDLQLKIQKAQAKIRDGLKTSQERPAPTSEKFTARSAEELDKERLDAAWASAIDQELVRSEILIGIEDERARKIVDINDQKNQTILDGLADFDDEQIAAVETFASVATDAVLEFAETGKFSGKKFAKGLIMGIGTTLVSKGMADIAMGVANQFNPTLFPAMISAPALIAAGAKEVALGGLMVAGGAAIGGGGGGSSGGGGGGGIGGGSLAGGMSTRSPDQGSENPKGFTIIIDNYTTPAQAGADIQRALDAAIERGLI